MHPTETHINVRISVFERPGGFYFLKNLKERGGMVLAVENAGYEHEVACRVL